MELHIGKEIKRVLDESGKKALWLAKQLNTSDRNLYDLLNREEISTGQLAQISRILNYDFFALYQSQLPDTSEVKSREKILVTVELDGLQSTLDRCISKLIAINKTL
jgi:hypothetical protein